MIKKQKKKADSGSSTWQKLAPKSSRKPASYAAFRKRLIRLTKVFVFLAILFVLGGVGWFFQQWDNSDSGPLDLTGPGEPVSKLSFSTDGVLHKRWFQNWFGPLRNRTLMDLDINNIQAELCKEPQIIIAQVVREFPSTLSINLKEKKPIMRLCLRSKSKGEQTWLVSAEGSLYRGTGYGKASLSHLPFLNIEPSLLKQKVNGIGFEELDGIPVVAPLLEIARRDYPSIYNNWQVLSYQRPQDNDPGAHIHIKSIKVRNLRFAPRNFTSQLRRLKYLLMEPDFRRNSVIELIDLSHDRSVFAKLNPS